MLRMNDFLNPQKHDTMLGFVCGTIGWLLHSMDFKMLQVNVGFSISAILMAFLCGAAGVLGKHCIVLFLRWYKKQYDKQDFKIKYKKK